MSRSLEGWAGALSVPAPRSSPLLGRGPAAPPVDDVRPGDAVAAVRRILADPDLLVLVAQPLVETTGGGVAGYELLSRVPQAWCVPPDALFAAARAAGVSHALHVRVVDEALRLRGSLPANTFLTMNVDPIDLAHPDVVAALTAPASLARVVVEVTEHAWPEDREGVDAALQAVRDLGGLIAADDVGAGYAGLNQLMRLRPDFVKLDRELVERLGDDPAAEALINASASPWCRGGCSVGPPRRGPPGTGPTSCAAARVGTRKEPSRP